MRISVTMLLMLLSFAAGAQTRLQLKQAELLVPRPWKQPVRSFVPSSEAPACDTLDTSDPAVKLILCEDGSWHYSKDFSVLADSSVFRKDWKTNVLNPYNTRLESLPFRITLSLADSASRFVCPCQVKVCSPFGRRRGRYHSGVDLPLPKGTPVPVAFDGEVRVAMSSRGYGNVVIVRHACGLETTYAHLSELKVGSGTWVRAGDIIGLGGSTGRSTGPHLHFETRYDGFAFDPQWLIDFENGILRQGVYVLKRRYLDSSCRYYPESEDDEEQILLSEEQERAEAERIAREKAAEKYHKVQSGDTLYGLALKYHTSVAAICKLNGIKADAPLRIGKSLRVK